MKTIKIIDLYRKIVMKEELPKKVKYKNKIYILDNEIEQNPYTYKENGNWKTYLIGATLWNCPTDEVEIIEEDKDITEVLEIELLGQSDNWLQRKTVNIKLDMELNPYILNAITRNFKLLYSKQCELIDEVNRLKGKYE